MEEKLEEMAREIVRLKEDEAKMLEEMKLKEEALHVKDDFI